ncbi:MAG: hypothetical protein HY791_32635 [Deltaproteobacteria bacterium]|nr:hypothetical protein [Deltaproteobacteria bacterium]
MKPSKHAGLGSRPEATQAPESTTDEGRALLCRACDSEISRSSLAFQVHGAGPTHVFPNPFGQMRRIVTVSSAWGLIFVGPRTIEFTWFVGYSWTVSCCARCRAHVGWKFETSEASPSEFFGLLLEAIREG